MPQNILRCNARHETTGAGQNQFILQLPDQHFSGIRIIAVRHGIEHRLPHDIRVVRRNSQFLQPKRDFMFGIGRAAENLLDAIQHVQQPGTELVVARHLSFARLPNVLYQVLRA